MVWERRGKNNGKTWQSEGGHFIEEKKNRSIKERISDAGRETSENISQDIFASTYVDDL